jgi:hypothetical protein
MHAAMTGSRLAIGDIPLRRLNDTPIPVGWRLRQVRVLAVYGSATFGRPA